MTTPRDAIGLSELLRKLANEHVYESPKLAVVAREAATQLDALQARVNELEGYLDGALRQRNSAERSSIDYAKRWEDAESRATRAEKERDEAYERAAKVADDMYCDIGYPIILCGQPPDAGCSE